MPRVMITMAGPTDTSKATEMSIAVRWPAMAEQAARSVSGREKRVDMSGRECSLLFRFGQFMIALPKKTMK